MILDTPCVFLKILTFSTNIYVRVTFIRIHDFIILFRFLNTNTFNYKITYSQIYVSSFRMNIHCVHIT